jgi:hypothetical protein
MDAGGLPVAYSPAPHCSLVDGHRMNSHSGGTRLALENVGALALRSSFRPIRTLRRDRSCWLLSSVHLDVCVLHVGHCQVWAGHRAAKARSGGGGRGSEHRKSLLLACAMESELCASRQSDPAVGSYRVMPPL